MDILASSQCNSHFQEIREIHRFRYYLETPPVNCFTALEVFMEICSAETMDFADFAEIFKCNLILLLKTLSIIVEYISIKNKTK